MRPLWILLGSAAVAFAQYGGAGSAEFVFLRNFQGSRMVGLCGIPAVGEDLSAMGLQPASFAHLEGPWVEIGSRQQMSQIGTGAAAYAAPLLGGFLAGRVDYQSSGDIRGLNEDGEETGVTHHPQEMLLDVAFSESLGDRFAWGAGLKAVEENLDIDNSQAWGLAADLGVVIQPGSRMFSHSFYVANLGTKLSGHTTDERTFGPMPLTFGYTLRTTPGTPRGMNLYTDIQKPVDNDVLVRLGIEHRVNEWVTLRGGFRTDIQELNDAFRVWVLQRQDPDNATLHDQRWAMGGTVSTGSLSLTYGFQWWQLLDAVHSVTLSWDIQGRSASAKSEETP